jgi:DNA ligase-1
MKSVMLAPNRQLAFTDPAIRYPMLSSPKFDGIRGVCVAGEILTRAMKPHKNQNLPEHLSDLVRLSRRLRLVFDFEIFDSTVRTFSEHMSVLGAFDKPIPDSMRCYIFDCITIAEWHGGPPRPFVERVARYEEVTEKFNEDRYTAVSQDIAHTASDAERYFEEHLSAGLEGSMLRHPESRYKHGRATINEGSIFKFKAFATADGRIVEVVQRRKMKEGLERTLTPTGHMERVHTQDSYGLDDMTGAFKVLFLDGQGRETVSEINYGRGFPHEVRRQHWAERDSLIGKMVEVRHLPHGAKEGIRIGTLVRFREDKE